MLDSCGTSGTAETTQARPSVSRRLSARPAESEHPVADINHHFYSKPFKMLITNFLSTPIMFAHNICNCFNRSAKLF
ncbi:hypothetical protein FBF83_16650 [Pseudalkalibacillus hwajinpoensis]|uniref:Uncharacterized protein n=1 Tax=Guptibacillus hwajinpoensis TaxID=208199 RepID=A0A4U1MEM5_9BACL|nr:hypothetical protein FBF83_16650 [Pseudalkalibacillus hwajinpoensis]